MQDSRLNRYWKPTQITLPELIISVICAQDSTFCITETKKVYFWGAGILVPTQVQLPPIEGLAAGKDHFFAWNETQVFAWGSNNEGKLGLNESVVQPTLFDIFSEAIEYGWRIQKIVVGLNHSVALIEVEQENKLFVWGSNTYQQLGFDEQSVSIPHQLDLDIQISDIYAQHNYTMAINKEGKVFAWGSNEFGRLGQNNFIKHMRLPSPIQTLQSLKITKLALGTFHVLALDQNGQTYSWGRGLQGQLGHGNFNDVNIPKCIISLSSIIDIACGESHSLTLTSNNQIMVFGSGQYGQLGLGDMKSINLPQQLMKGEQISCGKYHSIILKEGLLYGFGNNDIGQVGVDPKRIYQTPKQNTNQIFEITEELMNKLETNPDQSQQHLIQYQQVIGQYNANQTAIFLKDLMERVVALMKRN